MDCTMINILTGLILLFASQRILLRQEWLLLYKRTVDCGL